MITKILFPDTTTSEFAMQIECVNNKPIDVSINSDKVVGSVNKVLHESNYVYVNGIRVAKSDGRYTSNKFADFYDVIMDCVSVDVDTVVNGNVVVYFEDGTSDTKEFSNFIRGGYYDELSRCF